MKNRGCLATVLIASFLAFGVTACKKSTTFQKPQTIDQGVAQLREALANNTSVSVQSNLYSGVAYGIRYGRYADVLEALDRMSSDPSLTAQQKQLVNDVMDLTKAALQNDQNKPAQ